MNLSLIDSYVYKTYRFTIESEDGELYNISLTENEFDSTWVVMDGNGEEIDEVSDLGIKLIEMCEENIEQMD